uniref:Uncharacterized protein n=1 Tax=Denticeps clupeoides TaxID=299321 RepID=A0AAY4A993_9TELE
FLLCVCLSVCGVVKPAPMSLHGEVKSPHYPQPYQPGTDVTWDLKVPVGYRIQLTITHLDIKQSDNCNQDSLTVLHDQKVLGKFCGEKTNQHLPGISPILSSSNHLQLIFKTSAANRGSDQHLGFTAFYTAIAQFLDIFHSEMKTVSYSSHGRAYCGILCLFVSTVCGRPTVTTSVHQRIIGGQWATPGSIPWQVLLTVPYGRGGAAVIGSRWILTAAVLTGNAHEEMNLSFQIYVGDNDILKMLGSPPFQVESLHVHPLYNNPKERNYNHDIALIKLKQHITFNTNIKPLCLPSRDHQYIPDTYGLVSGFGMTETKIPTKLRFVRVPLVKDDVCRKSIEKITNETSEDFKFTENMFCAGFPEGGRDSCSGDSGGAFALENNNQFWAAGIVSWGINCGEAGKYGVYTRVAQNFIKNSKK